MNHRLIAKYLGHFVCALSVLMIPSAAWSAYFHEVRVLEAFALAMAVSLGVGVALAFYGRKAANELYQREALGLVGLSWIVAAGLGALPYVFAGVFDPVDAYFESMSGFTTTGSSVLTDIEGASKGILFWRSFTHWLGGMGIIVLFIAVLPYLGAGGKMLFKSESPGPDPRGLRPKIQDTATILYTIYLGFTVLETAALMMAGMSLFDALCHTFGTLATGGFSTRQASVGGFDSVSIDLIIVFFMVCAGMNFGLYFAMLRGQWRAPWRDTEWRVYMLLLAGATALITLNLMGGQFHSPIENGVRDAGVTMGPPALNPAEAGGALPGTRYYASPWQALRYASFQAASIMTTTGYCTADFDTWPHFSRMLLLALMFVGGCAGSTGGGIKVVRIVMLAKMAYRQLEVTFRPKAVRAIRISGQVVEEDTQRTVYAFFVLYLGWFVCGTLFMSLLGLPFQTAATSVAATLNNIGPGLEAVGATMDYHLVPDVGKVFLSLCMALGRLELFSVMVLFVPTFWRQR